MNQTTKDVIEFLSVPGLDFGTNPLDLEEMQDAALMRDLTARLLNGPLPSEKSRAAAASLSERLDQADWDKIAQEMRERVSLTLGFFSPIAEENVKHENAK